MPSPRRTSEWSHSAIPSAAWTDFLGAWEDVRIEVQEYRELDGERVLVPFIRRARGAASGVELDGTLGASLFHVRDGRVTRLVVYLEGVPEL